MAHTTRRAFLRDGWKAGASLLAVAGGWTLWESLRPFTGSGGGAKLTLGKVGSYQAGTATFVPEGRLFLANTGKTLLAISQKCPHLGCQVPFCESSGRFECPCHGSVFDIGGEWIEGPSPIGMSQYAVSLAGESVVVDTSKLTAGPARGAKQFLTPAKGPKCKKA